VATRTGSTATTVFPAGTVAVTTVAAGITTTTAGGVTTITTTMVTVITKTMATAAGTNEHSLDSGLRTVLCVVP